MLFYRTALAAASRSALARRRTRGRCRRSREAPSRGWATQDAVTDEAEKESRDGLRDREPPRQRIDSLVRVRIAERTPMRNEVTRAQAQKHERADHRRGGCGGVPAQDQDEGHNCQQRRRRACRHYKYGRPGDPLADVVATKERLAAAKTATAMGVW